MRLRPQEGGITMSWARNNPGAFRVPNTTDIMLAAPEGNDLDAFMTREADLSLISLR